MPNELIEAGDPKAKVAGRRKPPEAGEASIHSLSTLNKTAMKLRGRPLKIKRGVYRFKTHEEADQWWMDLYQT